MSATYTLMCDDCKVKYWAGQSHARDGSHYLYDVEALARFLEEHGGATGHGLRYVCDYAEDERQMGYADWVDPGEQKEKGDE